MSDFKEDRAAFEAATPGEWKYYVEESYPEGPIAEILSENEAILYCDNEARDFTNFALITRMHSTYLARMARIEELEELVHVHEKSAELREKRILKKLQRCDAMYAALELERDMWRRRFKSEVAALDARLEHGSAEELRPRKKRDTTEHG